MEIALFLPSCPNVRLIFYATLFFMLTSRVIFIAIDIPGNEVIALDEIEVEYDYTEKEIMFCDEYMKNPNGKRAALNAGYAEASATVTASQMLKKPKIQARLKMLKDDLEGSLKAHFLAAALKARKVLEEIMDDDDAPSMVRYNAAVQFLDRAGFKPPEKQEVTSNQSIRVDFNIPRPPKKEPTE